MAIKAKFEYTKENFLKHVTVNSRNKFNKAMNITVWVCFVIMLILLALEIFVLEAEPDEIYGTVFLTAFVAVMGIITVFIPKLVSKMAANTKLMEKQFGTQFEYEFTEDTIEIKTLAQDSDSIQHLKYTALYRVVETADAFYLYLAPLVAQQLAKEGIYEGSAEDLSRLLKEKLPKKKYITIKK
jgi:uncharacterized Tic20 family protein